MEKEKIQKNIDKNIETLENLFSDDLLKTRNIVNINNPKQRFVIMYFGNLVNRDYIQNSIVEPILEFTGKFEGKKTFETLEESVLFASEVNKVNKFDEIATELMMGRTILFIDKFDRALSMETNDRIIRGNQEPETEQVLRGPREGFNESLLDNISLVRRKVLTPEFKIEYYKLGKNTQTNYCICYIKNLVDKKALEELKKRLKGLNVDAVLDTYAINQLIKDRTLSPFETVFLMEKPDTFVSKLLEGKAGVIIDGTPVAMTVPNLFVENFQTSEDYYVSPYFASLSRIARIFSFFISLYLPAVYVAVVTMHWEVLPVDLSFAIAQGKMGTPFPTVLECFLLMSVFEILRETGVRVPTGVGQSLSVVGAIVIGQAAVEAQLASPTMVFIVALTAITGLINYNMKGAAIVLRYVNLLISSVFGLYGCLFSFFLIMTHLFSIRSFGVQFMEKYVPFKLENVKDSIIRAPMKNINQTGEN